MLSPSDVAFYREQGYLNAEIDNPRYEFEGPTARVLNSHASTSHQLGTSRSNRPNGESRSSQPLA